MTDTRPQWFTVESGLLTGTWTQRWTEINRRDGKIVCRRWPNVVQAFNPGDLLTEEQAGQKLEQLRHHKTQ